MERKKAVPELMWVLGVGSELEHVIALNIKHFVTLTSLCLKGPINQGRKATVCWLVNMSARSVKRGMFEPDAALD